MAVETKTRNAGPGTGISKLFRDIKSEFKKITWPSKDEIIDSTKKVFVTVAIFTLILWLFDSVFGTLLKTVIEKITK